MSDCYPTGCAYKPSSETPRPARREAVGLAGRSPWRQPLVPFGETVAIVLTTPKVSFLFHTGDRWPFHKCYPRVMCRPRPKCFPQLRCRPSKFCYPMLKCLPRQECCPKRHCRPSKVCYPARDCLPSAPCCPQCDCRPNLQCCPQQNCLSV